MFCKCLSILNFAGLEAGLCGLIGLLSLLPLRRLECDLPFRSNPPSRSNRTILIGKGQTTDHRAALGTPEQSRKAKTRAAARTPRPSPRTRCGAWLATSGTDGLSQRRQKATTKLAKPRVKHGRRGVGSGSGLPIQSGPWLKQLADGSYQDLKNFDCLAGTSGKRSVCRRLGCMIWNKPKLYCGHETKGHKDNPDRQHYRCTARLGTA